MEYRNEEYNSFFQEFAPEFFSRVLLGDLFFKRDLDQYLFPRFIQINMKIELVL